MKHPSAQSAVHDALREAQAQALTFDALPVRLDRRRRISRRTLAATWLLLALLLPGAIFIWLPDEQLPADRTLNSATAFPWHRGMTSSATADSGEAPVPVALATKAALNPPTACSSETCNLDVRRAALAAATAAARTGVTDTFGPSLEWAEWWHEQTSTLAQPPARWPGLPNSVPPPSSVATTDDGGAN